MGETVGVLDIGSGFVKFLANFIDEDNTRTDPLVIEKRESKGIEEGVIVRASAARSVIRELLNRPGSNTAPNLANFTF